MSALDVFAQLGVELDDQFATYRVRLRCIDKLVGGIPSNKSVIKSWLKAKMQLEDRDLQEMANQILHARFPDRQPGADELADALMETDAASVNGFLRHPVTRELVFEGRCMKAAIKEWANSSYPGSDWDGKPPASKDTKTKKAHDSGVGRPLPPGFKKGLLNTIVERAFVEEIFIPLGVTEPTGVEERFKHVMTPQGPRNSISRVEYVYQPTLEFRLRVRDDFLPLTAWARIFQAGEQIGIGADRGRSDGRFELLEFARC